MDPVTSSSQRAMDLGAGPPITAAPSPWSRQLYWILYKNNLLLYRRPITIFLMIISSVISVFLSWYSGRDTDKILPELDQCGAVPTELLSVMDWEELQNYVFTLNESWRNGFAVTVMSLGPFVHAVCVFLLVRTEIEAKVSCNSFSVNGCTSDQ